MTSRDAPLLGKPHPENTVMSTATTTTGAKIALYGDFNAGYRIVDRLGGTAELIPHLFGATNRFPTGSGVSTTTGGSEAASSQPTPSATSRSSDGRQEGAARRQGQLRLQSQRRAAHRPRRGDRPQRPPGRETAPGPVRAREGNSSVTGLGPGAPPGRVHPVTAGCVRVQLGRGGQASRNGLCRVIDGDPVPRPEIPCRDRLRLRENLRDPSGIAPPRPALSMVGDSYSIGGGPVPWNHPSPVGRTAHCGAQRGGQHGALELFLLLIRWFWGATRGATRRLDGAPWRRGR